MTPRQQHPDGIESAETFDVVAAAGRLETALDAVAAIVDECLLAVEADGLVLRARDPADVVMAELALAPDAFESYDVDPVRFGIALDRVRNAVSLADDDGPVRVTRSGDHRLLVTAGELEYALAPIDPDAVRRVEWIESESTAARLTMSAGRLRRAVRAADLVADHATMTVDPDAETLSVAAAGDTDDVELEFARGDLEGFEPGAVESIYSVDYLRALVGAVPRDGEATLSFVGTDGSAGSPLSLRYGFADGEGTGRWLLAPRIKR